MADFRSALLFHAILILAFFASVSVSLSEKELFTSALGKSMKRARTSYALISRRRSSLRTSPSANDIAVAASADCVELFERTLHQLTASFAVVRNSQIVENMNERAADVQTWISAALTNQDACLHGFSNGRKHENLTSTAILADRLSRSIAKTLSYFESWKRSVTDRHRRGHGLSEELTDSPCWLLGSERALLEKKRVNLVKRADIVVAKDGTSRFRSISAGVKAASRKRRNGTRILIHVKAGTYKEIVRIPSSLDNVMLVGDGAHSTRLVGSRNTIDGWTTFDTATLVVMSDGFIARDISFVNRAGPEKQQAVALLLASDKSVIYRCNIIGYQDTLYALSQRQFYRECNIFGTVDFIFGNAAVVFQKCNIFARTPVSGQFVTVTAQGRTHPQQNTGFSFQDCRVTRDITEKATKSVYLGRPWKAYSRTIFMQCFLDDVVSPLGWHPWSGNFALKTLFYAEFQNYGPGASPVRRAKWPGFRVLKNTGEAAMFTVRSFISGDEWLPSTGVTFLPGLF